MELVSKDRDQDTNDLHSIGLQPSGCTLSSSDRTTGVVDRSLILSKTRSQVGPSPRRSLRIADQPPAATVHDLEAHIRRHRTRRSTTSLETPGQYLSVPTLEPDPNGPAEDQAGEDIGNHHNTVLAVSSMVPDDQNDVRDSADAHPSPPSPSGSRKRTRHPREEPPLVFMRMEGKRRRLLDKGWDTNTASIVLDNPAMQRKQQQYASIQDRYISWATNRGVDAMVPQPEQLLNWLASGISINKWTSGTVQLYKAAIINMYEEKSAFTDPDFQHFFQALRHREIRHTKELDIDLTPVLDHFRQQGPNENLAILPLTQKLCWLLGTCGFLRPNDIQCIDLSNNRFHLHQISTVLPIMIPKETRGGNRICRYTTISSHDDLLLCPIKALSEYLQRIQGHEITVAHPKDASIQYSPLIRDTRDISKPIGTERISKHISNISRLIALPADAKMPKARAIGSTAAIKKGATVDDVVTHGHWSSSILFDQFYRLNAATATNFTSMVLA